MLSLTPLAATGIGSVPFTDPEETVSLIMETLPQMPYWPQMVRLGFGEEMTAQAARGLAALKIDEAARTVELDPGLPRDEALAQFYEAVLTGELEPFAMEEEEAHGFFALLRAVAAGEEPLPGLEGPTGGTGDLCRHGQRPGRQGHPLRPGTDPGGVPGPGPQGRLAGPKIPGPGQRSGHLS